MSRTRTDNGLVRVQVDFPAGIVRAMRAQSIGLPGLVRKTEGSTAHFLRCAGYAMLEKSLQPEKILNVLRADQKYRQNLPIGDHGKIQ